MRASHPCQPVYQLRPFWFFTWQGKAKGSFVRIARIANDETFGRGLRHLSDGDAEYQAIHDRQVLQPCEPDSGTELKKMGRPKLSSKADAQAFVRESGVAVAKHLKSQRRHYLVAWHRFVEFATGCMKKAKRSRRTPPVMTEELRDDFIGWLKRVPKVSQKAAALYSACMDRMMEATIGRCTKLRDKAGGRSFTQEYGEMVTEEVGKRSREHMAAWTHFQNYVHLVPFSSKGKPVTLLVMTEEVRGDFTDWLERMPKINPYKAREYAACLDRLMDAIVGEGTNIQNKAAGRSFVREHGEAVAKKLGKRRGDFKTAWFHFQRYVCNAPVKPRARGALPRAREAARASVSSGSSSSSSSSESDWESADDSSST